MTAAAASFMVATERMLPSEDIYHAIYRELSSWFREGVGETAKSALPILS